MLVSTTINYLRLQFRKVEFFVLGVYQRVSCHEMAEGRFSGVIGAEDEDGRIVFLAERLNGTDGDEHPL
jgi:hypothetical protein